MNLPDDVVAYLTTEAIIQACLTIGAVLFAAGAVWAMLKRVWPGLLTLIKFIQALGRLPDFMEGAEKRMQGLSDDISEVKHEVLPNNGGSMRDELETVSLQVQQLKAHQENDYHRINELEDTITRRVERRQLASAPVPLPPPDIPNFPSQNTEE